MKNIKLLLEQQLAEDYNCTLSEVQSNSHIIKETALNPKARPVADEGCLLKIACYNEKLLVSADKSLLDWCRATFSDANAVWFSEPQNLVMINEKLKEHGQCLQDIHHYYVPDGRISIPEKRFDEVWYEGDEIRIFEGDRRFGEAVLFDEKTPDMLAVTIVEDGEILGMAGATADCEDLWQLGINVTEKGRGRGVGAYAVELLKNRVLEMGKIPFYGTVESHIKSQKVAVKAGFLPAFLEMHS